MKYSIEKNGFYEGSINYLNIPSDAVEVDSETCDLIRTAVSTGLEIVLTNKNKISIASSKTDEWDADNQVWIRDEQKEASLLLEKSIKELQAARNVKLNSAIVEVEGMIFDAKESDLSLMKVAIETKETRWFLNNNTTANVDEVILTEVIEKGTILNKKIWSDFFDDVEGLTEPEVVEESVVEPEVKVEPEITEEV